MTILCKSELVALNECKEIIERGLDGFIEVGNALLRVRNEKLYRMEYDTFELWCELTFGMSDRHVHRMIDAAQVAGNIGVTQWVKTTEPSLATALPSNRPNERQMRPLTSLTPPDQIEAWNQAKEETPKGKLPTAAKVAEVVRRITGRPVTIGLHGEVKNSQTLRQLKYLWKFASVNQREDFRMWIATQP